MPIPYKIEILNLNQNHIEIKIFDFEKGYQEINDLLGLKPTAKWLKNDEYLVGQSPNQTTRLRKENYWGYEHFKETNDYIGNQIDDFIKKIIVPRTKSLRDLANKYHTEFSVVQYMYESCNPGFFLEQSQLEILAQCGFGLNVDIYVLSEKNEI